MSNPLLLDRNDARVIRAQNAERDLQAAYQLAVKEHFIFLEALQIHIRVCEYGTGAPLLVVPGNTGDSFVLLPLLAQLCGRRILALNRPGGGLSEGIDHHTVDFKTLAVSTIDSVLDYFGLACVPILAHSMGGHWSLWYAMERPQRAEKLVLLGVPGNVLDCKPPLILRAAAIPRLNRLLFSRIAAKDASTALRGLRMMGHSAESIRALPAAMADCYYHFQRLPHYETASLSLMESTNTRRGSKKSVHIGRAALAAVPKEVLLLWGENDPFGAVKKGEAIAAALPNAALHVIPRGGHLPWLDAAAECAAQILRFLQ